MSAAGGAPATVAVCDVDDVPEGGCLAVADGQVLLTKVDGHVAGFRNRCLHKGARLDDGFVDRGYVTCPLHFWRYRLADGRKAGGGAALERVTVTVVGREVRVVPPAPPPSSLRELLLEHARTWNREGPTE